MDSELQLLEKDIKKSLKEQHPELVLDRLHTLSVKIIRRFCEENNIAVFNEKNELYPLHSLVGMLVKKYNQRGILNNFSETALKQSISIFEKFNDIRNNSSFAHDNEILTKEDAVYVINTIVNLLNYIVYIETGKSQYVNINVADANDIYKYICINDIVTTREISENFNISIDEANEILIELFKVNRAIRPAHLACNPEDENCQWSKYY